MSAVRLRYPLAVERGRLACIQGEADAVAQVLALCRDLAPGDFGAFPGLANPCDLPHHFELERLAAELDELGRRIQALFASLGRDDVRAQGELAGARVAIVIQGGREPATFRMRVPLEVSPGRAVLRVDEYEVLA